MRLLAIVMTMPLASRNSVGTITFPSQAGLRRPQAQKPRENVERKFRRKGQVSTRLEIHWLDNRLSKPRRCELVTIAATDCPSPREPRNKRQARPTEQQTKRLRFQCLSTS